MTQYARPVSDVSVGSWTDEGTVDNDGSLYTSLDEVSQDGDDSYVLAAPGAGTFEVMLDSVDDPESSSGHILHVYGESTGGTTPDRVDVSLYDGASLIVLSEDWAPGRSGYVDLNLTLLSTEADAIVDYSDLRVRVDLITLGGGETFKITQAYLQVPDAPVVGGAVSGLAMLGVG